MLKAGFSRVDVTPPLGSYISGYFTDRYAKGIIDPLYLNAVAVSDGNVTVLIIVADFIGIKESYATTIRKMIGSRTGVSENHIIISALHQHTSICLSDHHKNNINKDKAYLDVLYRKFCDVAQMAIDDMSDAIIAIAEREALEEIAFIRRYLLKDGTTMTNAKPSNGIERPLGEQDHTVRLLRFRREGKKDIAMVNFQTHPDVIGGELFSADWPGYTRRFLEEDIEGICCIVVNGTQGDSNHFDPKLEVRNKGIEYSRYMGRVITDTVKTIWDKTEDYGDVKINASVDYVYQMTRTDGAEYYDECVEKMAAIKEGKLTQDAVNHVGGRGGARRIINMRTAPLFQKIPVSVISLGKIAFVGFGGEPFMHYVAAVREACPDKYVVALCCANGYEGYLPTKSAFTEGGYEASSSPFQPTLEEDCVKAAVKMIKNFQ